MCDKHKSILSGSQALANKQKDGSAREKHVGYAKR
jgi:hypothetical protein